MTNDEFKKIDEAAAFILQRWDKTPRAGIILGSGLGDLTEEISEDVTIDYFDIPHFPQPTAAGHKGRLICGEIAGVNVAAMAGRCHLYEGHSADDIALPVQVMNRLGAELLMVSNASGGVNPNFKTGDVMVIEDHINLMHQWPKMTNKKLDSKTSLYDSSLVLTALEIARQNNFIAQRGTYVAVKGPNYETRAEYRLFRKIGGDVVGMSTVPEVLAAAASGMQVLALSVVTNVADPDALGKTDHEQVLSAAKQAAANLRTIVVATIRKEISRNAD